MRSWVLQDCEYCLFLYKKHYMLERSVQTYEWMWILTTPISHGRGCSWIQDWNEDIYIRKSASCPCRPEDWDQRLQHGLSPEREHKPADTSLAKSYVPTWKDRFSTPILFSQNSFSSNFYSSAIKYHFLELPAPHWVLRWLSCRIRLYPVKVEKQKIQNWSSGQFLAELDK